MMGWIKLHRKIFDNEYYFSEPFTRTQAWIDLLLLANNKDNCFFKRGIKIEIKRGQVGYDLDTIAKRWQWSRGKVERFFILLENSQQIVRQKNNVTTLISINNYFEYQANNKANSKADNKTDDKPDGHQTVKQTDTNKKELEGKEGKEGKEKKPQPHLFENSQFYELAKFIFEIELDEKYRRFDLDYYHESIKNWSAGGKTKLNWIATAKNWMLRDLKKNEAKLKPKDQPEEIKVSIPKYENPVIPVQKTKAEIIVPTKKLPSVSLAGLA